MKYNAFTVYEFDLSTFISFQVFIYVIYEKIECQVETSSLFYNLILMHELI